MRCRGLHGVANPAFPEGFPFSGLLSIAPYCVPGGVRVVSEVRELRVTRSPSLDTRVGFGDGLPATFESTPYAILLPPMTAVQMSDVTISARQSLAACPRR